MPYMSRYYPQPGPGRIRELVNGEPGWLRHVRGAIRAGREIATEVRRQRGPLPEIEAGLRTAAPAVPWLLLAGLGLIFLMRKR